jgi:SAM-dependent methyltransferase
VSTVPGPALTFDAWLRLREPADAAARNVDLVDLVLPHLPAGSRLVVHDLGSGTGSMARWLAQLLPGPQHWVLHDRDPELLAVAAGDPPTTAADGTPVTVETRCHDITRLPSEAMAGAALVTASALLDMFSSADLERFVATCVAAGCPSLIALSVTGAVRFGSEDPLDRSVETAFNAHQRRTTDRGMLLGPDAVDAAADAFSALGAGTVLRPSPWRLGPSDADLAAEWFRGWVGAATEQRPELAAEWAPYADRRLAELAAGRATVSVGHQDLLALPGRTRR